MKFNQGRWTFWFMAGLIFFIPDITIAAQAATPEIKKAVIMNTPLKAQLSLEQAQKTMTTRIYKGKIGQRALYANPKLKPAGAKIGSWKIPSKLVVSKPSWFFFVDEQPGANWEHKASYILVDKASGEVTRVPAMSPPREALTLKPLNKKAKTQMTLMKAGAKLTRTKMRVKPIRLVRQEKYAVLLCGGWNSSSNYARYWNDLQFIFTTLKQKYGYSDSQIIVLYANGTHSPSEDFDGDGINDIDYATTQANLTTVFNMVAANISSSGKFFFYATNHGGNDPGDYQANLTLWQDSIRDDEFANLTKKIKCREAIYVFEQCFSGGMVDDILNAAPKPCTGPRICVMAAARHDEPSWGCDTEGQYDEYVYHWTSAVYGKTPGGARVDADANNDGKVTMKEAHNYAKAKDSRNEHPVIGSCVTGACDTTLAVNKPAKEDCLSFNPSQISVVKKQNRWKVADGKSWLFDFGSNKAEAVKALKTIKHYRMDKTCYVGRPDPSFTFLLVKNKAPKGGMPGEDCIKFNPQRLQVKKVNNRWKIVDSKSFLFDFASKKDEAIQALNQIKKYGFTQTCYLGRPDPSFSYLKK